MQNQAVNGSRRNIVSHFAAGENDGFDGLMKIIARGVSMPAMVQLDEDQKDKINQVIKQYEVKQEKLKGRYLGEFCGCSYQLSTPLSAMV